MSLQTLLIWLMIIKLSRKNTFNGRSKLRNSIHQINFWKDNDTNILLNGWNLKKL